MPQGPNGSITRTGARFSRLGERASPRTDRCAGPRWLENSSESTISPDIHEHRRRKWFSVAAPRGTGNWASPKPRKYRCPRALEAPELEREHDLRGWSVQSHMSSRGQGHQDRGLPGPIFVPLSDRQTCPKLENGQGFSLSQGRTRLKVDPRPPEETLS